MGWRKLVAVTAQAEWARRPKLESAGRKKFKCVQVKLIELGLCLEIARDTLESTLSIPSGVATVGTHTFISPHHS